MIISTHVLLWKAFLWKLGNRNWKRLIFSVYFDAVKAKHAKVNKNQPSTVAIFLLFIMHKFVNVFYLFYVNLFVNVFRPGDILT